MKPLGKWRSRRLRLSLSCLQRWRHLSKSTNSLRLPRKLDLNREMLEETTTITCPPRLTRSRDLLITTFPLFNMHQRKIQIPQCYSSHSKMTRWLERNSKRIHQKTTMKFSWWVKQTFNQLKKARNHKMIEPFRQIWLICDWVSITGQGLMRHQSKRLEEESDRKKRGHHLWIRIYILKN